MNKIFENLLVSSPNGGGLFFIHEGEVFKLDNFYTTGLSMKGRKLLRGIQPSKVWLYNDEVREITQNTVFFDDIHDVYLYGKFIYLVGTSGNEILKLNDMGEEIQRWIFPGEKDSLHINSLEKWNGNIVFSAFGEFIEHRGYKGKTESSGFVQDLNTSQRLITGLSQPHSLVPIGHDLLLANSEKKELRKYAPTGDLIRTLTLDGYTRGICVVDNVIYIGLSCSRNIEIHGDCTAALVALDQITWEELGRIYLPVDEIYAIQGFFERNDVIHVLANIASKSSSNLTAAISEHEVQITSLKQITAERDGQIAILNHAVTERDGQIAILNHAVTERDGQIAILNHAVTERDGQIAILNHAVTENETKVRRLISSRSWRFTMPLRVLGRLIRGEFKLVFQPISSKISRYPLLLGGHLRTSRIVRWLYFKLPLSYPARMRIRSLFTYSVAGNASQNSSVGASDGTAELQNWDILPQLSQEWICDPINTSNTQPTVSVIIPCFNQGEFLIESVSSAFAAYSGEVEVIIVDDGSESVVTHKCLREIVDLFPKVKLISQKNSGLSSARNAGIRESTGYYIQFLDADDILVPGKIDAQIAHLRGTKNSVSICNYLLADERMERLFKSQETIAPFSLNITSFLYKWERALSIPIHCGLFNHLVFENLYFNTELTAKEDWVFWCDLVGNGHVPVYIDLHGAIYRQHGGSMRRSFVTMGRQWLRAVMILERQWGEEFPDFLDHSIEWLDKYYRSHPKYKAEIDLVSCR
jgi:glycosyltransferase involved in cell wall biosynthesis